MRKVCERTLQHSVQQRMQVRAIGFLNQLDPRARTNTRDTLAGLCRDLELCLIGDGALTAGLDGSSRWVMPVLLRLADTPGEFRGHRLLVVDQLG